MASNGERWTVELHIRAQKEMRMCYWTLETRCMASESLAALPPAVIRKAEMVSGETGSKADEISQHCSRCDLDFSCCL